MMEYVYCDNCKRIVPYKVDFLPANDKNPDDAQDIVCDECSLVITTFHEGKQRRQKQKLLECGHPHDCLVEREITNIEKNEGPLNDTEYCALCV